MINTYSKVETAAYGISVFRCLQKNILKTSWCFKPYVCSRTSNCWCSCAAATLPHPVQQDDSTNCSLGVLFLSSRIGESPERASNLITNYPFVIKLSPQLLPLQQLRDGKYILRLTCLILYNEYLALACHEHVARVETTSTGLSFFVGLYKASLRNILVLKLYVCFHSSHCCHHCRSSSDRIFSSIFEY